VHVSDLVDAHITAMNALQTGAARKYNVGIGKGYSVREVIKACRRVTGVNFKSVMGERREGDPPSLFADPTKIQRELNWRAAHTDLHKIIDSAWRWKQMHPNGYGRAD
jgi:UDP-glucose 4-epimerase